MIKINKVIQLFGQLKIEPLIKNIINIQESQLLHSLACMKRQFYWIFECFFAYHFGKQNYESQQIMAVKHTMLNYLVEKKFKGMSEKHILSNIYKKINKNEGSAQEWLGHLIETNIFNLIWIRFSQYDIIYKSMLSSLRLTSVTYIGRQQQKKLLLIIAYLIDLPQAAEFINPVDWQQLQLTDYPLIVKHPMNLLKVQDKLKGREYRTIEEVLDHTQLVWDNCKAYNPEGAFYVLADKMERAFKKMIRNYLPNIQVIVPKPTLSNSNHRESHPHHNPSLNNNPKPQPKQSIRPSAIPLNNYAINNSSAYDEPLSVNEPGENLPQVQQIPQSQKNRFHQRLKQLTQQQLAQIVSIVQQNCVEGFKQLGGGRCQLILDNIDLQTFKKMNQRMDDLLDSQKGVVGSKKLKV